MSSRAASPRALVLAAVVAAHAGALLVLVAETRARQVRSEPGAQPLLVVLFEPLAHPAPAAPVVRAARPPAFGHHPRATAEVEAPAPPVPIAPGSAINWTAEAIAAAAREIEGAEQRARQARALAPRPSPMFAARPKRRGLRWDPASTHRLEPVPGLGTIIHLNEQCAIFVFVIIPIAGGCALGKPPVHGDLFEHMHDPDPGTEP